MRYRFRSCAARTIFGPSAGTLPQPVPINLIMVIKHHIDEAEDDKSINGIKVAS